MTSIQKLLDSYKLHRHEYSIALFCLAIFVGFVSSRVLITIGVAGLTLTGAMIFLQQRKITESRVMLSPVLFFVIILVSGIHSKDIQMWSMWMVLKLPFLLLPIAFFLLPTFSENLIQWLLKAFVWVMLGSMLVVFVRYGLHYEQINESLRAGGRMPVPYSHIRYSLLLTIAFFVSGWLYQTERKTQYVLLLVFFFASLHFISVRSGLLALYTGILFVLGYYLIRTKQWKMATIGFAAVVVLSFGALQCMPSLKNRLAFMQYDFGQWKQGNIDGNSDAMRIASIESGVELWKRNIWFGVGAGDILSDSKALEALMFPNIHEVKSLKMPHNEFLWTACVLGILGISIFLMAWLWPVIVYCNVLNWLFVVIQLIFFVSFMVEYTIEEQIGGTLFVLFQLLFYKWFSSLQWNLSR